MIKFKIIETKQTVKEKEDGSLRRGIDALAHTLHFVLGVNTSLIGSIEGIWDVWKKWKEGLKKIKQKPEEKVMLYLAKDKNGIKLLKQYIFDPGADNKPLFGLFQNAEYPSGHPVIAQCYLMQQPSGTAEDGNTFITSLDAATRTTTNATVFDQLASKFSIDSATIANMVEQYVKRGIKEITQEKLLKLGNAQKEIQSAGSSMNWTKYGEILNGFIKNFL